jgi:carbon storage regulator CsrA
MLVLSRRIDEVVEIGDDIRVKVVRIDGRNVRLGIDAPRHVAVRRPEAVIRPKSLVVPAAAGRRILIVDDSPEDRQAYRRLIQRGAPAEDVSFTFAETDSGEDGLELCRTERPDCVLLDYRLPDLDGLEFLDELRGRRESSIPVVMLTGHGDETIAVAAMKRGAADYVPKHELTGEKLRSVLQEVLTPGRPAAWSGGMRV